MVLANQSWFEPTSGRRVFHVRWLLTSADPPRHNVLVETSDGIVEAIHSAPQSAVGNALPVVVVPPLVNVHTHLEFSSLPAPLGPRESFTDWIRNVVAWRHQQTEPLQSALQAGLRESANAGVVAIGDIATSDAVVPWEPSAELSGGPQHLIRFREVLGLGDARIADQLQGLGRHLEANCAAGIVPAVSPHAPYSVHPDLLNAAVGLAVSHSVPLTMHLAETPAELQLLRDGNGPFAEMLQQLGAWRGDVFTGDYNIRYCLEQLARCSRALAVHGNYFTTADLHFLAANPHVATVYCPRTHAWFQHTPHCWKVLRKLGGRVVLGTDGRSSNPDLSIWKELQLVARQAPELPADQLIPMVTTDAADALGLPREDFTIAIGRPFCATVIESRDLAANDTDCIRLSQTGKPIAVIRDGRCITAMSQANWRC
ncbi:MAG: amidohydrolase family protein [Planctomycetaceae bacterium]|nr:amidohydrolase family protein [Planctomycetaceae bacterium]